jgi:hypothetical protein
MIELLLHVYIEEEKTCAGMRMPSQVGLQKIFKIYSLFVFDLKFFYSISI